MIKMGCCGYESSMEWINVSCAHVCLTRPSLSSPAHSLLPLFIFYPSTILYLSYTLHPVHLAHPHPRLLSHLCSALLDLVAIPLPLPFLFSVDIPLPFLSPSRCQFAPLLFSFWLLFPSLLPSLAIPPWIQTLPLTPSLLPLLFCFPFDC